MILASHLLWRTSKRILHFSSTATISRCIPCLPSPLKRMASTAAAAVEEGSAARRFWIRCRRESTLASYTPFVVCLAAGSLPLDVFRNYVAQDIHFLAAFAKAYEMAEDCADDDDDKATISKLRKAILDEMDMHDDVMQGWGVDPTKEITPNPATTKYTNFLLATALGKVDGGKGSSKIATPFERTKVAAYTVGAMTPCMRLYANLGKELQIYLRQGESDHPYKRWIGTYSSRDFEANTVQMEELLDKLSVSLTGEELEVIGKLYQQAMKLEVEFFLAQPITEPTILPLTRYLESKSKLLFFSDFDLTCTLVDSSAILAEIAILSSQKAIMSGEKVLDQTSSFDLRNAWNQLSKQYTEDYEQCIRSLLPSKEAMVLQYAELEKSLELLSDFEKLANNRVIDSGVLRGMNFDDITKAGERLMLQDGCKIFFQKLISSKQALDLEVHILSYCWCADLIRSAFSSAGCASDVNIYSNEFVFEASISTGAIERKMESPLDKVKKFRSIMSQIDGGRPHMSIYVGDSVGDLLCLLEADVGIVIGSSSSLRRVGKQFGVSFVPLLSGLVAKQRQIVGQQPSLVWTGLSGTLFTVSSWSEIHAFILGCNLS